MLVRSGQPIIGSSVAHRAITSRLSTLAAFDKIDRHDGWRSSNWGANIRWGGGNAKLAEPTSLAELQEIVRAARCVRCIGVWGCA